MINFSKNFNALGPPPGLEELVRRNASRIVEDYGQFPPSTVQSSVANYLGVEPGNVSTGVGSTEVLFSLPQVFAKDTSLELFPTFWEYAEASRRDGRAVEEIDVFSEEGPISEIKKTLHKNPALVTLCNPNNPTGTMLARDEVIGLADKFRDSDFVVDETYLQFRPTFDEETLSTEAVIRSNLHVVHSFSKFFAIPGIRFGALVSNEQTIQKYEKKRIPYANSPLTDIVLHWALGQEDYIRESRVKSRGYSLGAYAVLLDELGDRLEVVRPKSNFIFVKQRDVGPVTLAKYLEQKGFIVRDGIEWGPRLDGCLRFCVKHPDVTSILLDEMIKFHK